MILLKLNSLFVGKTLNKHSAKMLNSPPLIHFPLQTSLHQSHWPHFVFFHLLTKWNTLQIKALIKPNGLNALLFTLLVLDSSQQDTERETDGSWAYWSIQHFSQYDSVLLLINNTIYLMGLQTAALYCVVDSVILFLSFSKCIWHYKSDRSYECYYWDE